MTEFVIRLREPHPRQLPFIRSKAKRKIIRAGRRSGKTEGVSILAVEMFLDGRRVLYAVPTADQLDAFWYSTCRALADPIEAGIMIKNETRHTIDYAPGYLVDAEIDDDNRRPRIRGKTAWNADTLRGDFADLLILDEYQLMNEDAWGTVGAPMLLDNNGDAVFVYTPPSLHSRSATKARDPQHAAKLYKRAQLQPDRWECYHFTSYDNPHISQEALEEIKLDMTNLAMRMEILAEDVNEAPGALWTRETLDSGRVLKCPDLDYIVVGVDPPTTTGGDACGIVTAGVQTTTEQFHTIGDDTISGSPLTWAQAVVAAYHKYQANKVVAEVNNGGEMVLQTIRTVDATVPVTMVYATRAKSIRAEPVAAIYEHGRAHHVGPFEALEDEMCIWLPGDPSPNRMDALVWAYTELMTIGGFGFGVLE